MASHGEMRAVWQSQEISISECCGVVVKLLWCFNLLFICLLEYSCFLPQGSYLQHSGLSVYLAKSRINQLFHIYHILETNNKWQEWQ